MAIEWIHTWKDASDGSAISITHGEERASVSLNSALNPIELREWAKAFERAADEIEAHYSTSPTSTESEA